MNGPSDEEIKRRLKEANYHKDIGPDPNYACQVCGWHTEIDDHQERTPSWCEGCKDMATFEKL